MAYKHQKIENQRHLEEALAHLEGPLIDILKAELLAGNTLESCTQGYPKKEDIFFMLNKIFQTPVQRDIPNLELDNTNDIHYWKACYIDHEHGLYLACPFEGLDFTAL